METAVASGQSLSWDCSVRTLILIHRREIDLTSGPQMLFINGRNRTQFAGAWTVLSESHSSLAELTDLRIVLLISDRS